MDTTGNGLDIREIPPEHIDDIVPLLRALDSPPSSELLHERLANMIAEGYRCVGAYADNCLVGCCGFRMFTRCQTGRHIAPDNVAVLPEYRSEGVGGALLDWIHRFGQEHGCVVAELNCGVGNATAHKFWFRQGYAISAFHFRRPL